MKKGVIMEINSKYLTLLTREGEFLKAKNLNKNYKIGEEISFYPSSDISTHKIKFFGRNKLRIMVGTSLAVMLVFFAFFPYLLNNQVYAYMSIDINPSIELGVNRHLKVISMEALNDDGNKIIEEIGDKWKKKDIEDVTKTIISEFKQDGYIKKDETILITTTIVNDEDNQKAKKELEEKVEEITTNYKEKDINIEAVTAKKEVRKKAKAKGVSTGQLLKIENKLPNQKPHHNPSQKVKQKNENNGALQKKSHQKPFVENKQIKQNEKAYLEQRKLNNHRNERRDRNNRNDRKKGNDHRNKFENKDHRDWEHKKIDRNRIMKHEQQNRKHNRNQNHQHKHHHNHNR